MSETQNKIIGYLHGRPWRLIAVAPWPVQLAVLFVVVGTLADILQNGFRFGFGTYTIISLVVAVVLATLVLSFRRVRIGSGILALVLGGICLLSVGKGISFADIGVAYTMFFVGALLLGKASRQWNVDVAALNGGITEVSAVVGAAKSVWKELLAHKAMLGLVVLGVVLYVAGMIGAMTDANVDGGRARRLSAQNKYVKEGRLEFDTSYPDLRESFWGLPWGSEPPEGCVAPCEIEYQVRNKPFSKAVFSYDANGLAHVSLSGAQSWDKDKCFLEFMKLRGFYEVKTHAPIKYSDEPVDGKYLGVGSGDMAVIVRVDIPGKSNCEVVVGLSRPR